MRKPSDFHPPVEENCFCGQSLAWNPNYKADIRNAVLESGGGCRVLASNLLSHPLEPLGNPKASGNTI